MADNISVTPGTGKTIAADEISSVLYQRIKPAFGVDGVATDVSASDPLPVVQTGTPALATGAATAARQDTGNTSVASIDTKTPALGQALAAASVPVVLTAAQVTTLTPPAAITGFATAAKQPALGAAGTPSTDVISVQGITSMTALKTDGSGVTQPVSYATTGSGTATGALRVELPTNGTGVIATVGAVTAITNALPAGTNAIGKLAANSGVDIGDVDVTTVGTITPGTAATSLGKAEDAAHASGDVGVFALGVANEAQTSLAADGDYIAQATDVKGNRLVIGNIAHDGVDAGAPVKIGGKAISSETTAVAAGDRTNFVTDLTGKQITLPYANPENFVSGAITSAMTGTTSTSLIAAPGAGLRNYITTIICSNAHATVGTDIAIQDGSGGTTLLTIPAAAVYGGAVITLPTPLRQPTANTALFCANVTTGASTKVSAVGYKGA